MRISIVISPKHKFILQHILNSCHFSSLRGTGEIATCNIRKEKKRKRRVASSDAAGRKIANILRHRRHRKRDGASNWRLVCIYSGARCPPSCPPTCFLCYRLILKAPKFTNDKRRQCRSRARSDISI